MPDVVDSIVADMIVQGLAKYEADFDRATAAHGRFTKSVTVLKGQTFDLAAEGQKYKAGADRIAQGEEQLTQRVTRTRRKRADDAVAQDEREVRSAKASAKAKADAEVAEAQRSARIRAAVERGVGKSTVAPGTGANLGRTIPREGTGQASIPAGALNAGASEAVAAEAEINHLMADQAILADRLRSTRGKDRDILAEQIGELRLIKQLQAAGLAEDEIALKLEQRRAFIEAERVKTARAGLLGSGAKFAEGAGLKRTGGGTAAIAGIATAVGIGVGVEVIQSAVEYGKALDNLSRQLGITVEDLQAYQKIARDVGVTQEQLTSAFGQFASNLGRAQQNEQEQVKVFKALGVNIRDFASAGDALPTVIDRISQIKDPAQRAAVETRLFGEEGRRLDALLSGGAARVSELSRALQETGRALSAKEIQELDQTARKLAEVKSQLQVDFARVVAGNSDAIIGLANSFATLANQVLNAISRLQQFGAMQINSGFLSGIASGDQRATARGFLLGTAGGRRELFNKNNSSIAGLLGVPESELSSPSTVARINQLIQRDGGGSSPRQAQLRQLVNERREILNAARGSVPAATPAVQPGAVDNTALRNLGTPKPPKGKSADQLAREAEAREKQFNDQLAQAQADFLRAQEQMTGSVERRAEIEQQLLKTAYDARLLDIDSQASRNKLAGADAKLEDARAAELKAAEKKAFDAQSSAIEQDKQLEIARALTQKQQTLLDAQQTLLGAQLAVAKTAAERRDIELKLLENAKDQERNRLNGIIASAKPGDPAADDARAQLGTLDERYGAQRKATEFANRGPLKTYLDSLPRTAAQVDEALENAAVGGLQSLNDGLTEAVGKFLHLNGIAGDFLKSLIKIGIERKLLIPLADKLFGGSESDGGGVGGLFGTLSKALGGSGKIGGSGIVAGDGGQGSEDILKTLGSFAAMFGRRASGGAVVAGVPYLLGENGPEVGVFGASGKVFPNGALPSIGRGAGGGMTIIAPQHFDLSGVLMTADLVRQFEARNRAYANQVGKAAAQGAIAAAPARLARFDKLGS